MSTILSEKEIKEAIVEYLTKRRIHAHIDSISFNYDEEDKEEYGEIVTYYDLTAEISDTEAVQ